MAASAQAGRGNYNNNQPSTNPLDKKIYWWANTLGLKRSLNALTITPKDNSGNNYSKFRAVVKRDLNSKNLFVVTGQQNVQLNNGNFVWKTVVTKQNNNKCYQLKIYIPTTYPKCLNTAVSTTMSKLKSLAISHKQ
ncbi:hypothetical protein HOK96_03255 [bacterium]|jgi:hypothetical protein|nr:hypothetical protein [bacterium]MBT5346037.1 hypothetical protein [bacterium]MBT6130949.1 hypothetical protein [bacterium]